MVQAVGVQRGQRRKDAAPAFRIGFVRFRSFPFRFRFRCGVISVSVVFRFGFVSILFRVGFGFGFRSVSVSVFVSVSHSTADAAGAAKAEIKVNVGMATNPLHRPAREIVELKNPGAKLHRKHAVPKLFGLPLLPATIS